MRYSGEGKGPGLYGEGRGDRDRGYPGILLGVLELNSRHWGIHLENVCQKLFFSPNLYSEIEVKGQLFMRGIQS